MVWSHARFADTFGIGTGLMKNCVDAFCIVLSLIMGLLFAGKPVGIGIGTVCAVMLVGRVIALFHHILKGDAAGGWTGNWQELTECVETACAKIKAADFE
ncbi:MAG: hypothetical protein ACLT76_02840 [Clostridium fessum]